MANWRNKSDPVARIIRRVFAFANDHTGYGLVVDGQEPFSVIQYLPGQEYRPHCDGSCDGSPHLHAGRVATMLMYCRVADEWGGTSFTKAGVHVKPKQGQAAFFSYRGANGTMDVELTEHSGCPVKSGVKWVVTQWLRSGVGKGESWSKFDPIGGRL
jgi:prolyl 4-hydroxylase